MGKAGKNTYAQVVRQRKVVEDLETQAAMIENDVAARELEYHEWDARAQQVSPPSPEQKKKK